MLTNMSSRPKPTHVLVFDLETTGLDERAPGASILEVGLILCERTAELPVIAEANLLIRPPGTAADHDIVWSQMPAAVQEMHRESGLWQEVTTKEAWAAWEADNALAGWVNTHAGNTAMLQPAGSGVAQFDMRWTAFFLPALYDRMHYRPLDASSLREGFFFAGREDLIDRVGHVDAKPHRALEDARLHRLELISYIDVLRKCGGGAAPKDDAAVLSDAL